MIKFSNVQLGYGRRPVLNALNFEIKKGDFFGIVGPNGAGKTTLLKAILGLLKPVKGEIGIITGDNSLDPWFSPVIPGEDDGKVSVESAKLDEMSDFITVHNGHTFIMRDQRVISQILYFLEHGRFSKEASPAVHD